MADDGLDFSLLDPTRDEAGFDARVGAIVRDAAIASQSDLSSQIVSWARPALAAAAVIAAVAIYPLTRHDRGSGGAPPATTADILGIPAPVIRLAQSGNAPGVDELAEALNTERDNVR